MKRVVLFSSIVCILFAGILFYLVRLGNYSRFIRYLPIPILIFGLIGILTGLFAWGILGERRAERMVSNLIISLITLIVMLVILELALRFIFRDVTATAGGGGYLDKTWYASVRLNQMGFREREFSLTKPEGIYRIAVIGDSITFGQGVGEQNRFTNLLEKRLNDTSRSYEVLNFGLPGAETLHHIDFLNAYVLKAEPDFILLQWFTNDVEGHDKSERPEPLTLIPREAREYLLLFDLLQQELNTFEVRLGFVNRYDDYMLDRFADPNSASSRAAAQALHTFIKIAKANKVPVGIVLYANHGLLDFLVERVLDSCKQEAITCLDLRSTFEPYHEKPSQLWASRLDHHPGILAHQLIANRILNTFGEAWINK